VTVLALVRPADEELVEAAATLLLMLGLLGTL